MFKISAKIGVTALFALALFGFSISQASAQGKQRPKVQGEFTVDCDKGESIQDALDKAASGARIEVSGTCEVIKTVIIVKNRIKLVGLPGTSIKGLAGSGDLIRVRGLNAEISGFDTLTGERRAIQVQRNGSVIIRNNVLTNSGSNAIGVGDGAYALIEDNQVTNNVGTAIIVGGAAAADIFGNNLSFNKNGITIADSAAADINDNLITNNPGAGINIRRNSSARLARTRSKSDPNTLERNGVGVRCRHFSYLLVVGNQNFGTGVDANVFADTDIPPAECALELDPGVVFP